MEAEGSPSRARKARAPPSHRVLVRKLRRTSWVCNHEDGPSVRRLKEYFPPLGDAVRSRSSRPRIEWRLVA